MKRIFKFPIPVTDHVQLLLPTGSRILSVMNQREQVVVYALVEDATLQKETWLIEIRGTGHPAMGLEDFQFVGTVEIAGALMFHVFARRVG
jgi:hypothetical protein